MNSRNLILCCVLLLGLFSGLIQDLRSQPLIDYLHYAEGAGQWLVSEALQVNNAQCWPDTSGGSDFYTELYKGSAGIISFFADLNEVTGNPLYSQYALEGAQWLMDKSVPETVGYSWPVMEGSNTVQPGLYTGIAGIGDSFTKLFELYGDSLYLDYAINAAFWLMDVAVFDSVDQCKWKFNMSYSDYATDIIGGSAGIGLFFLRLYDVTNQSEFLDYARYAGNWLTKQAVQDGNGYKWEISNNNPAVYTGFSHGTAGIGYYLAELFKYTNDNSHLHYAEGAALWLMDIAIPESGGCKWWLKEDPSPIYATGWCHGPAGTCLLFIQLYEVTQNNIYLNYAQMGATWLISNGTYQYDVTMCHGPAGVGDFFLEMYRITQDSVYFTNANNAAAFLVTEAENSSGGYCWPSFGAYYTGFSIGTTGVGHFFLRMYKADLPQLSIEQSYSSDDLYICNYPNPFSNSTTIICKGLRLSFNERAELQIYNSAGMLVRSISISGSESPDIIASWDGRNNFGVELNSGTYYARLSSTNRPWLSTKLIYIK